MSFSLRDSVIKTHDGKIKYRQFSEGGAEHYHIGVWLTNSDDSEMDQVEFVEYTLHPSFSRRERRSSNRDNDFSITFWAWGAFQIEARVHFVDPGMTPQTLHHKLGVRLPADTGDNYEKVD